MACMHIYLYTTHQRTYIGKRLIALISCVARLFFLHAAPSRVPRDLQRGQVPVNGTYVEDICVDNTGYVTTYNLG